MSIEDKPLVFPEMHHYTGHADGVTDRFGKPCGFVLRYRIGHCEIEVRDKLSTLAETLVNNAYMLEIHGHIVFDKMKDIFAGNCRTRGSRAEVIMPNVALPICAPTPSN